MSDDIIDKETEHFKIAITKCRETDNGHKARVEINYKGNDFPPYDADTTITGRGVARLAGDVMDINGLEGDEYVKEIKQAVLTSKKKIKDLASQRKQQSTSGVETGEKTGLDKLLKEVFLQDKPTIEELSREINDVQRLQRENEELIIRSGDKLVLTKDGVRKAKEILGFDKFDGNVKEEAEKQLEENPLKYYIDSFSKVHKGDPLLKIWQFISALSSRCGERQIHSWGSGPSGKGKSHLNRNTLKFIPEEFYEMKNSISPKSMYYKAEEQGTDFMNNQLIYFDEVDDMDEDTVVLLRSLTDQDEDVIEHEMVRDQNFEQLVLETGNVTVWFTSVETINDEQLKNRFIITNPDGSADLDNQVFNHQMKRLHSGKELDFVPKEAPVIKQMFKNVMEDTDYLTVILPFETVWKQKFNRRLYPYFVTLVRMITKIHYKNREIEVLEEDGEGEPIKGRIYATRGDFELAALIWDRLVDTTIAQQDREALKLLEHLPESQEEAMTSSELGMTLSGFSTGKARRKAQQLQETEELNLINVDPEGGRYSYWAGEDRKKLVDNEPEITINDRIVEEMIPEDAENKDEIVDSVLDTETPVYDELKQRHEEAKERRETDAEEDVDVEVTEEEKRVISQFQEYKWDVTVDSAEKMDSEVEDYWEHVESLEDKGIVRVEERNGGELFAQPEKTLDLLKQKNVL